MSYLIDVFPGIIDKQYFQNPDTKEFWFHATAVCKEMGFENPSRTLMMHCDEDEKFQEIFEGKATWFISEAGIYGLAMISKSPSAKKFKRWLKHDVLPKLRSQGYYIAKTDDETLARLKADIKTLEQENALLESNFHRAVQNLEGMTIKEMFDYFGNHGFNIFGAKKKAIKQELLHDYQSIGSARNMDLSVYAYNDVCKVVHKHLKKTDDGGDTAGRFKARFMY